MLCERCGKNIADVFLVKMVGGKRYEEHLCHECAQDFLPKEEVARMMNMSVNLENIPPQLKEMLKDMISPELTGENCEEVVLPGFVPCPHCGKMIAREYIEEYADKNPDSSDETDVPLNERESLERMMQLAVKEENYELAAEYRDRIRKLSEEADGENE